jgi:hypothetical protein
MNKVEPPKSISNAVVMSAWTGSCRPKSQSEFGNRPQWNLEVRGRGLLPLRPLLVGSFKRPQNAPEPTNLLLQRVGIDHRLHRPIGSQSISAMSLLACSFMVHPLDPLHLNTAPA